LPFLLSLLCRQGADNRLRFFAINLACYFSLLLFSTIINIKLLVLLILVSTSYVLAMTTLRRLKDAKLKSNWLVITVVSYSIIGLAIIFIANSAINWLILLPATLSALLLTYRSKEKNDYILGYSGPVDLSQYQAHSTSQQSSRVEPVFSTNSSSTIQQNVFNNDEKIEDSIVDSSSSNFVRQPNNIHANLSTTYDFGENIREKLITNSKFILIGFSIFVILIITISIVETTSSIQQTPSINNPVSHIESTASPFKLEHLYPLKMPDNFTLYLSQYKGLIIHWQGEESSKTQLWSLTTAKGDDSCQSIKFNKGKSFRILSVNIENEIDHFAAFSPLDTQALLQAIAFRGSFSLCDFTFSLKGSQAALNKNNLYAEFIEY